MRSEIGFTGLLIAGLIFVQGCARSKAPPVPAVHVASVDKILSEQSGRIPPEAMSVAFEYFRAHAADIMNKDYITIIDFDQPSTAKRMHVIDLKTGQVEDLLVAHAKKSGENMATQFSNVSGSNMSSLGIYLTGKQIVSRKHGTAMLLHGKESSNDNALRREIIFHGADYVSEEFITKNGRLGRSLGCPAVEYRFVERLVEQLKGGSVMLIYKRSAAPTVATTAER